MRLRISKGVTQCDQIGQIFKPFKKEPKNGSILGDFLEIVKILVFNVQARKNIENSILQFF